MKKLSVLLLLATGVLSHMAVGMTAYSWASMECACTRRRQRTGFHRTAASGPLWAGSCTADRPRTMVPEKKPIKSRAAQEQILCNPVFLYSRRPGCL